MFFNLCQKGYKLMYWTMGYILNFNCVVFKHIASIDILRLKLVLMWREHVNIDVSIGSSNGLLEADPKPLPDPILARLYSVTWYLEVQMN